MPHSWRERARYVARIRLKSIVAHDDDDPRDVIDCGSDSHCDPFD